MLVQQQETTPCNHLAAVIHILIELEKTITECTGTLNVIDQLNKSGKNVPQDEVARISELLGSATQERDYIHSELKKIVNIDLESMLSAISE